MAGCKNIDTTDHMFKPDGLTDEQALDMMKGIYEKVIEVAELYKMNINIEPHGYYTTKPEFMEKMVNFVDSEYLGMNFDTGNTFIAGQDPVVFLEYAVDVARVVAPVSIEALGWLIGPVRIRREHEEEERRLDLLEPLDGPLGVLGDEVGVEFGGGIFDSGIR